MRLYSLEPPNIYLRTITECRRCLAGQDLWISGNPVKGISEMKFLRHCPLSTVHCPGFSTTPFLIIFTSRDNFSACLDFFTYLHVGETGIWNNTRNELKAYLLRQKMGSIYMLVLLASLSEYLLFHTA